ncbi:hypothetical protein L9F63_010850, partial [Diploptera punctata]
MFTKLKNKIAEEVKQSPLKLSASVQQLAQAVVSPSSSSVVEPASNDHFSIGDDSEETPQNSPSKSGGFHSVDLHGDVPASSPVPQGGRSRRSSTCSISSEASSLFPIFETSVVNSFNPQKHFLHRMFEVEDSVGHQLGAISKEQLYSAYRKMQARYSKYKGRYADLARHYRELDRENVKAKTILVESQDKALRRIAELKEQCQLEQKAKAHLEDALRNDLEEKDHLISTLYTKIELMKLNGGKECDDSQSQKGNSSENLLIDLSTEQNNTDGKVKKLEILLSKCKESIKRNKDRIAELTSENQQLQNTLEDAKRSSSSQMKTLTEDLTAAQQEIVRLGEDLKTLRKREEDAALSLAENKLTIHRELEAKEEQIKSLRESLTQLTKDKEALVERATSLQNEVTELKSTTSVTSNLEDISNSEEDRQNLIQELSRGKAEAVRLLQQEMQKKLIELEDKMSAKLRTTENEKIELSAKLEILKNQIEEKDQVNRDLEQKLLSFTKENNSSEKVNNNYRNNSELEITLKELEQQLHATQKELLEKEKTISNMELGTKSHDNQLLNLESKIQAETADKLQVENKLASKENEMRELINKHNKEMDRKLKALEETHSQLDSELLKKSETEKKNKDLLNQIGNMESVLKSKEAEIVILKEKTMNQDINLREISEECSKVKKEKENINAAFVMTLDSVSKLKSCLQMLRKDVFNSLNIVKDDIFTMGSQVSDVFVKTNQELMKVKSELQDKDILESKLRTNLAELEKELKEQKDNRELENITKTSESKEQELSHLHNSFNVLQHELMQVKSEYAAKETECNDLQHKFRENHDKVQNLQSDSNNTERKLIEITAIYKTVKEENEKLSKELKDIEAKNEALKLEMTAVCEEQTNFAVTVEELTTNLEKSKQERDELNKLLKERTDSVSNSNEMVENLTKELMNSNEEKENLSSKLNETSKKIIKFNNDIKSLEDSLNNKVKLYNEKIKDLEASLNSAKEECEAQKQNFEDKISTLRSELEESQHKKQELMADVEKLSEERFKNSGEASDYEKSIRNLQTQLDESHKMAQELSLRIENIKKENANQKQILKKKQSEIKNLMEEKEHILAKVQDLETKLLTLNEEKNKWANEKICFENNEKELEKSYSYLEEKLLLEVQEKTLLEEKYKRIKDNNEDLRKQLDELSSEVRNLHETNLITNTTIENLKLERNSLEESVNLRKQDVIKIENLEKEVTKLKSENNNLNLALNEKLNELEKLTSEMMTRQEILGESKQELEKTKEENIYLEQHISNITQEKKYIEEQLAELRKESENFLKEKSDLEQKLNNALGNLEETKVKIKTQQEKYVEEMNKLKQELETTLKEKNETECKLKSAADSSVEAKEMILDIEKLQEEKQQLECHLDNTLLDLQAKEKQVAELEEIHTQKIKQLVRDFEKKLAEKNEELHNLEDKKFEKQEQEENLKMREYREKIKELQEASQAQGEAFRQLYQKHEDAIQEKQIESKNFEEKTKELQEVHQRELTKSDERWRQCLEQQLAEAEARHKEELMELSKEWHWERKSSALDSQTSEQKELESTSQLAVAAVESGTGSIELLHRQLVAQTNELKEAKRLHKLEVAELRRLLSLRRASISSGRSHTNSTLEDACTELEYLRNILFEYMMGKEPVVLARVIAAVVKFDTEQTAKVLQKEEQKQTL